MKPLVFWILTDEGYERVTREEWWAFDGWKTMAPEGRSPVWEFVADWLAGFGGRELI